MSEATDWKNYWARTSITENATLPGLLLMKTHRAALRKALCSLPWFWRGMKFGFSVLEVGCGAGDTMAVYRDLGFKDLRGIDISIEALKQAEKKHGFVIGRDLFVMDATHIAFPDRSFGIVSSEGLWEHFPDPTPLIVEACRVSNRYMIAIQPDHQSLVGGVCKWVQDRYRKNETLYEYSHTMNDYEKIAEKRGFWVRKVQSSLLREAKVLVFERMNK